MCCIINCLTHLFLMSQWSSHEHGESMESCNSAGNRASVLIVQKQGTIPPKPRLTPRGGTASLGVLGTTLPENQRLRAEASLPAPPCRDPPLRASPGPASSQTSHLSRSPGGWERHPRPRAQPPCPVHDRGFRRGGREACGQRCRLLLPGQPRKDGAIRAGAGV